MSTRPILLTAPLARVVSLTAAQDFYFEVVEPIGHIACGSSHLLLNGQPLDQAWANHQWLQGGDGRSNVSVASSITSLNHTLELSAKSICISGSLTGSVYSPLPATNGDAVQITFVHIDSIDGKPSLSQSGFTVSFDRAKQRIIGVVNSLEEPSVVEEETVEDQDDTYSAPTISDDSSIASLSQASVISDESSKLHYLQNELDALTVAVQNQQAVVDDLIDPDDTHSLTENPNCRNVKCLTRKILSKAKLCVHGAVVRLTPEKHHPTGTTIDPECYWSHSRQARMTAAMKGEKLCAEQAGAAQSASTPSPTKTAKSRPTSTSTESPYTTSDSSDTIHAILVPITVIASFCCLSCFALHLHSRCCNPRARAERAARREEVRTRRQYRRLARQHQWRTWWKTRFGRNSKPRSGDYEEKRSLIQAQERVLEAAMQNEIQRIRYEHGFFDEEAVPGPSEILPPYRSRAGSGRPPSYTSEPVETEATSTVVGNFVSDVTCGLQEGPPPSPVSEFTPDSSIANLSRRNSTDTLHSERSLV